MATTFYFTGSAFLITARAKAVWFENIVRDPRVALIVDNPTPPHFWINVRGVAEIIGEPGTQSEWADKVRLTGARAVGEDRVDHYMASSPDVPRALISIPFNYPSEFVKTWRPIANGDDLTGLYHPRYGTHTKRKSDNPAAFEGWNQPGDRPAGSPSS